MPLLLATTSAASYTGEQDRIDLTLHVETFQSTQADAENVTAIELALREESALPRNPRSAITQEIWEVVERLRELTQHLSNKNQAKR